jgi:alkanesulfonate monooxygenase SsuD/methylene tetrahydromethanopterin reductase-like flavin-dependent oxidoreductase (luciferase family)
VRFGIEVPQDAPFPALVERWQRAEELGFDHLWVADHSADTRTDHSGATATSTGLGSMVGRSWLLWPRRPRASGSGPW